MNKIREIIESGQVQRYHTVLTLRSQTNADHQWGTAILVHQIYPQASKELILAALTHDVFEIESGDIPSPFKWENPDIKKLIVKQECRLSQRLGLPWLVDKFEIAILKAADCMEMIIFCQREQRLGNSSLYPIINRLIKHIEQLDLSEDIIDNIQSVLGFWLSKNGENK